MPDKPLIWIASSLDDVRGFPEQARRKAGFELRVIQRGSTPSDFKPMNVVGTGVHEIRIRSRDSFRVFYVARFPEAVYVLHAFKKKSQRTARKDIAWGQRRYKEMLDLRQQHSR